MASISKVLSRKQKLKRQGILWDDVEGNKKASRDIRELFNGDKVFDFPKPVGLLMKGNSNWIR